MRYAGPVCSLVGFVSRGLHWDSHQKADLGLWKPICCSEKPECLWIYILQVQPTSPVCMKLESFSWRGIFRAKSRTVPGKLRWSVIQCTPNTTSGQSLANIRLVLEPESPVLCLKLGQTFRYNYAPHLLSGSSWGGNLLYLHLPSCILVPGSPSFIIISHASSPPCHSLISPLKTPAFPCQEITGCVCHRNPQGGHKFHCSQMFVLPLN